MSMGLCSTSMGFVCSEYGVGIGRAPVLNRGDFHMERHRFGNSAPNKGFSNSTQRPSMSTRATIIQVPTMCPFISMELRKSAADEFEPRQRCVCVVV